MRLTPAIVPSSGGGKYVKFAEKAIRLVRFGCTNRPFYHLIVILKGRHQHSQPIEQLGSYDPMPNHNNEKLVAFNFERIQYWIGEGAVVTKPAAELLGLAGFLPMHPRTLLTAERNRKQAAQQTQAKDDEIDEKEVT